MENIFSLLRDPNVVWYGPYPCPCCTKPIVQSGNGAPKLTLDASDHNHHYPNHRWVEHVCVPVLVKTKTIRPPKKKIRNATKKKP